MVYYYYYYYYYNYYYNYNYNYNYYIFYCYYHCFDVITARAHRDEFSIIPIRRLLAQIHHHHRHHHGYQFIAI